MPAAKKSPAVKASEPVDAAVAAGKETVETVVKAGNDVVKGYSDFVSFGRDNVEAVMSSSTTLMKGVQNLNEVVYGLAQDSLEENAALAKKLMACKTLEDMVSLQNSAAKAACEKGFAESKKLSQLTMKLAEDVAAPINGRVNAAVEVLSKPIAA